MTPASDRFSAAGQEGNREPIRESEYRRVIVEFLSSRPGQRATVEEIREHVEATLDLGPRDMEPSGEAGHTRWLHRIASALAGMKRRGEMENPARGVWALTAEVLPEMQERSNAEADDAKGEWATGTYGVSLRPLDAARRLLEEAGQPLHYREITRRALRQGLWHTRGKTPENTISYYLSQDVRNRGRSSTFVRTGRGFYALREQAESWSTLAEPGESERSPRDRADADSAAGGAVLEGVGELEDILESLAAMDDLPTTSKHGQACGTVYLRVEGYEFCVSRPDPGTWQIETLRDTLPGDDMPDKVRWLCERLRFDTSVRPSWGTGRVHIWRGLRSAAIIEPGPDDVLAWFGPTERHVQPQETGEEMAGLLQRVMSLPMAERHRANGSGTVCGTVLLRRQGHCLCIRKSRAGSWAVECLCDTLPGTRMRDKAAWLESEAGIRFFGPTPTGTTSPSRLHFWLCLKQAELVDPGEDDCLAWLGSDGDGAPVAGQAGPHWHRDMAARLEPEFRAIGKFLEGQYFEPDAEERLPFWVELCYRAGALRETVSLAHRLPSERLESDPRLRRIVKAARARCE